MSAVDRLVSALDAAIDKQDNAAIIDAGSKLLAHDSEDRDAFQAVVTAHLNESDYTEAFALLQRMPQHTGDFPFLHSYCLYRLNRFEDALAIIGPGDVDKAQVALKAQCLYRSGKYAEVISLYTDLLDDPDFDRIEVLTNICAAAAGAGLSRDFLKEYREELGDSVDLLYNSR
jgi:tetratricopeptide (TPR) repeat protein